MGKGWCLCMSRVQQSEILCSCKMEQRYQSVPYNLSVVGLARLDVLQCSLVCLIYNAFTFSCMGLCLSQGRIPCWTCSVAAETRLLSRGSNVTQSACRLLSEARVKARLSTTAGGGAGSIPLPVSRLLCPRGISRVAHGLGQWWKPTQSGKAQSYSSQSEIWWWLARLLLTFVQSQVTSWIASIVSVSWRPVCFENMISVSTESFTTATRIFQPVTVVNNLFILNMSAVNINAQDA